MLGKLIISFVKFYQRFISPALGQRCRYHPTCSQYMMDAVQTHGGVKGGLMGIGRILRCHPFVKGGIDYVPLRFSLRRNPDEEYHGPYNYRRHEK
ncbi:membrane protein insertion efficiency factor YidD [Enterococcus sp. BWM-S5]|uniref:Putative membrane protein insertion efficiency factor n=1 Tax=Enterococcus larvae TaxID=2794352 RepID=A0ABS4CED2_9ENTE|nr:membrane protein insertion efficiency factor YidD [Enterococcus larvae]MBP1044970.1 membrane protein insertion efficiency factor YidD [Enterococcus larvae]